MFWWSIQEPDKDNRRKREGTQTKEVGGIQSEVIRDTGEDHCWGKEKIRNEQEKCTILPRILRNSQRSKR